MNSRQRVMATIRGEERDQLALMPITMQFAADRIGRKYKEYATDYRVLVEGQLRVVEAFSLDHVSAISDPAREAADCGAKVIFHDHSPPAVDEANALLAEKRALTNLKRPDVHAGRMLDRVRAVEELNRQVGTEKMVEGWVEGPCAEAADLRGINTLMLDFYDDEKFVTDLFEFVLEMEVAFARAQIEAGAMLIGIGDAAASLVGPDIYERFVFPFEYRMAAAIRDLGGLVRLHICGNTSPLLQRMGEVGAHIVDLDYPASMEEARRVMPTNPVLLGNIDPVRVLRDGTPEQVYAAIGRCHLQAGAKYIVGAGCEVTRDTPEANVWAMTRYAYEHKP